jgi:hypothetical protein
MQRVREGLYTEKPLNSHKNAYSSAISRWTVAMAHGGLKIGISSANDEEPSRRSWNRPPLTASRGTETRRAVLAGRRTLDRVLKRIRERRDASSRP